MHFKFHNVRSRQKCAKFISRLFHTNVLWTIFFSRKNDKVLMVGYPRQIMFEAHALVSPQNGLDWKSTKNPWAAQTTQPVSASVCPRLHNKGQHVGEATKIFLEYKILSIPDGQKSVCYKCLEIQFKWKIIGWMLIWLYGVRQPWHLADGHHLVLYLISENIMGIKLPRKVGN